MPQTSLSATERSFGLVPIETDYADCRLLLFFAFRYEKNAGIGNIGKNFGS